MGLERKCILYSQHSTPVNLTSSSLALLLCHPWEPQHSGALAGWGEELAFEPSEEKQGR